MPRLSVLMPVRNGAGTVEHAVRSTLRAMPRDSELVVFDDASADRTLDVLAAIVDRRLRVVESSVNVGQGAASARLMAMTDSVYVARMDADDVCLPWRFTAQLARLAHGRADILFSPVLRFRTSPLRISPSSPAAITAPALPLHLAVMCIVMGPTMAARRQPVEDIGGYHAVEAEDYELWLRACTSGLRLERTAVPVLAYRRHAAQISFRSGPRTKGAAELRGPYQEFTQAVLGVDCRWLPGTPAESQGEREAVMALGRALDERSQSLTAWQRLLLRRTMSQLPVVSDAG